MDYPRFTEIDPFFLIDTWEVDFQHDAITWSQGRSHQSDYHRDRKILFQSMNMATKGHLRTSQSHARACWKFRTAGQAWLMHEAACFLFFAYHVEDEEESAKIENFALAFVNKTYWQKILDGIQPMDGAVGRIKIDDRTARILQHFEKGTRKAWILLEQERELRFGVWVQLGIEVVQIEEQENSKSNLIARTRTSGPVHNSRPESTFSDSQPSNTTMELIHKSPGSKTPPREIWWATPYLEQEEHGGSNHSIGTMVEQLGVQKLS